MPIFHNWICPECGGERGTPVPPESPLVGLDGQLMIMSAHEYALGRRSYIVHSCIEWLRRWWPQVEAKSRHVIVRNTIEALMDNRAGDKIGIRLWAEFAEWAYAKMGDGERRSVFDAVQHLNKPWPLNN